MTDKAKKFGNKASDAALKKAILEAASERAKHSGAFRPDRARRATLQQSRRESDKILSELLRKTGFDIERFQALQEQRTVQLEGMVAKHKADALQRASQQKALHSNIVKGVKALGNPAKLGFSNPTFTLDKPFLIWSNPLIEIDSAIVPFGSWAKFNFATSGPQGSQNAETVSFYFYWPNPFKDYAVINTSTSLSATGYLKSHASWAVDSNGAYVEAWAYFNVSHGYPNDVVSPATVPAAYLGGTGALGGLLGGDDEGTSISDPVSLFQTYYAVPPGDVVVFEVALQLVYGCDGDGDKIEADFADGDFQIFCPLVVFSLLNNPPGSKATGTKTTQ